MPMIKQLLYSVPAVKLLLQHYVLFLPQLYMLQLKQVSPEAKKKAAEAKSRGQDAFQRKDYHAALDAYTQVHS